MGGKGGGFNAFLGFDIQSFVLHELLCVVSRPSSTSTLSAFLFLFHGHGETQPRHDRCAPDTSTRRGESRICAVTDPAAEPAATPPPSRLQRCMEQRLPMSPCPRKGGEAKKPPSCLPCASAKPWQPVPSQGPLRENKRWRRKTGAAGCGDASRAPASPSHPPCVAHAEAKPKAAGPSPGSAAAPVLASKAEESRENSDPGSFVVFCLPQRLLPWSSLESGCAKSTRPSPDVAQTLLCPRQFGFVLGEPRLTPLQIHGVFPSPPLKRPPRRAWRQDGLGHKKDKKKSPTISRCFRGASRRRTRTFLSRGLFRRRLARHLCQNHFRFV